MRINLVIGSHATNVGKGCGDYVPTTTPTVTSTLQAAGYYTAHYGKWHIGSSAAYNDTAGYHPAAPSPKHYGVDASECYACNPDTAADALDLADPWFPANSSRILVDAGLEVQGLRHHFWTISPAFLSPVPSRPRCAACSSW